MKRFGLIGRPLGHSYSAEYFSDKFAREHIAGCYDLFELPSIDDLNSLPDDICGFNVTIPYKREIMPLLDEISEEARAVGAVNCVACRNGRRIGYNTDVIGVRSTLDTLLADAASPVKALLLGTGGASRAVRYVLGERNIEFATVSRNPSGGELSYEGLSPETIAEYRLIVNATPSGMYPHIEEAPLLPYEALTEGHYLFDLIYNPPVTRFLRYGLSAGAHIANGERMFVGQAEASWRIWNAD